MSIWKGSVGLQNHEPGHELAKTLATKKEKVSEKKDFFTFSKVALNYFVVYILRVNIFSP